MLSLRIKTLAAGNSPGAVCLKRFTSQTSIDIIKGFKKYTRDNQKQNETNNNKTNT